jgi:hypothetical protein
MSVDEFVSDFEKGIWRGIEEVFPNTDMIGSAFHWTQAINRVNKRAGKGGVNFYELIPLLLKESQLIEVQIKILSQAATIQCKTNSLIFAGKTSGNMGSLCKQTNKDLRFAQTLFQVVC